MKTHTHFSASVFIKPMIVIKSIIFIASFFVAFNLTAQTEQLPPDHQGWYQVEMIIFSRNNPSLQEHFPTNIPLHYPSHWQVLKNSNALTTTANSMDLDTTQTNTIDFNTQAFYTLPADMRQLNTQANKFTRSSEYKVLFHQAWRQPIVNKNQANWILIKGDSNDEHSSTLSGAIRLSVATYLRLDTNLWFAEFEPKLDDSENAWPELPDSPDQIAAETNAGTLFSSEVDTEDDEITPQWKTKRILLLKSKLDMRSKEVNYIDHPVLGILVVISPFTPQPN